MRSPPDASAPAPSQVRGPSRTPTALVVAQQTLLALSSSLRLAFLLLVASRCPPREAWARELASSRAAQRRAAAAEEEAADGEPKTLRSGFDDDEEEEDHARAVHSGLWSACSSGMLGRVLRLKAWMLVVAVAVLVRRPALPLAPLPERALTLIERPSSL